MRLIFHAGFHKTGTSSVQQALALNRAALSPHLRILLKPDMPALTEAARTASRIENDGADAPAWALLTYEAAHVLSALDADDPRPVVLSSEDLSGHMPFRQGRPDYGAAPRLMAALKDVAQRAVPGAVVEFLFTTRAAAPWVASCHAQHLRATRMTDDLDTFAARALPHADLTAMIDRIAAAVAPSPVHRAALEDTGPRRLGPVEALFDHIALPARTRAALTPPERANRALPAETQVELLALNRASTDWTATHDAKRAVIRAARRRAAQAGDATAAQDRPA